MNKLNEKLIDEVDEHIAVLESAREALNQTRTNLEIGRIRLENAIKKYEERARIDGTIKHL